MSIERRTNRDGTRSWRVRWRQDGRNRSRAFRTRRDAELYEAEITRQRRLGSLATLDGGAQTLGAFVAERWAPEVAHGLATATRKAYASLWEVHIEPTFGQTPMREISAPRITAWLAQRRRDGAGDVALRKAHTLLGGILAYGVEQGEIQHNAARAGRRQKGRKAEPVRAWSPVEIEAVRAVMDDRDRALVSVLGYGGVRPAEALALRWADFDPETRTLTIVRALDLAGGGTVKATKTGAHRVVKLYGVVADDLAAWRSQTEGSTDPTAPIFPPLAATWSKETWRNWRERRWRSAVKAAGLDYQRPYALRHAAASLMFAQGRPAHYVSGQLGNSPELCTRTYGHLIAKYEDGGRIDAEREIARAREIGPHVPATYPPAAREATGEQHPERASLAAVGDAG